jgi:hypothetical protein
MKPYAIWLTALIVWSSFGCVATAAEKGRLVDERNKEALLKYLRPALSSTGGMARLYYSTACYAEDEYPMPFPRVHPQQSSKDASGLEAVREVFHGNKAVAVTRDKSGMVRITIGKPASAILRTKIHSLHLEPLAQYNPIMTIGAIGDSKEVRATMQKLGLKLPPGIVDMGLVPPEKPFPHLPTVLKDVTVDQALDLIARTFGGIVSYGTCADSKGAHFFDMDYIEVGRSAIAKPASKSTPD